MTQQIKRNKNLEIMTTLNIKYGKVLTAIKTQNETSSISTEKISDLYKIVAEVETFSIVLSLSKVKKTIKIIQSLGFSVELDKDFGFDFECKMYCNLIYS